MKKSASIVISFRMEEVDFRKLQLIAKVYGKPVGVLIREAVQKHIGVIACTEDFNTKASEVLRQQAKMLDEFLVASGVIKKK